jgi:flagellin
MSGITLSAGVRANLLALQQTSAEMTTTQNDLATGLKVNSALDNPLSFFTAQSLNTRANALSGLLDAMSNGVQTIQAANNGLTSITSLVQQLQSTVNQAEADTTTAPVTASTATQIGLSNTSIAGGQLTFTLASGNAVSVSTVANGAPSAKLTGSAPANGAGINAGAGSSITITSGNINGGNAINVSLAGVTTEAGAISAINNAIAAADPTNGGHLWAQDTTAAPSGIIQLVNDQGYSITVANGATNSAGNIAALFGATTTSTAGTTTPLSVSDLVAAINGNSALNTSVKASVDGTTGGLDLQNLTTSSIGLKGATANTVSGLATDNTLSLAAGTGGGLSSVRSSLLNQFNGLITQINQVASDSGYNGTNLLNGNTLNLQFNENGTSTISIHTSDSNGNAFAITAAALGINTGNGGNATGAQFGDNTQLNTLGSNLKNALTTLQTQSSEISSALSVVQTRQSFTNAMVNTLQTGANNLTVADPNAEGANLLALQTRQSLSTTALSLSAQSDRNVLKLFGG